ncbi:MAG: hypothetical protein H8Z69_02970 [Nanohaloarchaea archaeon]|nr:hypothetical protein [Candidatus Nanohaloarchaea archaeon]
MGLFETLVQNMSQMDLFHLFFPWLLITAITYGALNKTEIFEEDTIDAAVALSVGFISMAGLLAFVPPNMFAHFGAALGFIVFGILGLLIVLAMAGVDVNDLADAGDTPLQGNPIAVAGIVLVGIALIGVTLTYTDLGGFLPGLSGDIDLSLNIGSEAIMQVLTMAFLLAMIGVVIKVTGEEG